MLRYLSLVFVLLFATAPSHAQVAPPRGTEFWLTFLDCFVIPLPSPENVLRLEIVAGPRDAQCLVALPSSGWSASVTVPASTAATVIVPFALAIPVTTERIETTAIHVTSSEPITLTAVNHRTRGSADATIALPVEALGSEYMVAAYESTGAFPSEMAIVAVADQTTVEIIPSCVTLGGKVAGVPFTVVLDRGQVYQVQSKENLTGTLVRIVDANECDRIAVFAGHYMATVDSCISADHLYEQMLPIAALDRSYFAVPFASRPGGDIVDIVAVFDSTLVRVGASTPVMLDAGEIHRIRLDAAALIDATKKIAVMQYARGKMCDNAADGDPFALQLRPIGVQTEADFVAPSGLSFKRHFVTIVAQTSTVSTVQIDGVAVAGFVPFADSVQYSWARTEVQPGAHRVTGSGLAAIVSYGYGDANSYGVDASFTRSLAPDVTLSVRCTCDGAVVAAPAGFESYRWSNGDTTAMINPRVSGNYSVEVTSKGGCVTQSSSTAIVVDEFKFAFSPGDTTVNAGDVIQCTLILGSRSNLATCALRIDRIALRFRASLLAPVWMKGGEIVADSIDGDDRIVTVELDADKLLFDMQAAFGDAWETPLVLHARGNDSCMTIVGDTIMRIMLNGCDVGGRRLFIDGDAALIKNVLPDPAHGNASIEFRTLEVGTTRLELYDALGRRIATLVEAVLDAGDHEVALDASSLSAGVYLLVMRTPTRDVTRRITIAR